MTTTATALNTFKVNVLENGNAAGAVRVTVARREDAPAAAIAAMVETAKAYNARYAGELNAHNLGWAVRSENAADYSAWGTIRKVAAR